MLQDLPTVGTSDDDWEICFGSTFLIKTKSNVDMPCAIHSLYIKSLCTDAQPLCIPGVEAGSNLSTITMLSALISAEGAYGLLGTHSSGREHWHCPLDLGNPSLALVSEESIQRQTTVCLWPELVMPHFTFSVVWSIMGITIEKECTSLYAAFIIQLC